MLHAFFLWNATLDTCIITERKVGVLQLVIDIATYKKKKKISFWLAAEEATPTHYFLFSCIHIHLVSCIHWSIVHYVTQENEGSVGPCWINSHTNYGPMLHFFKIWGTLWLFNCAYIFILFMWFESSLIPFDR